MAGSGLAYGSVPDTPRGHLRSCRTLAETQRCAGSERQGTNGAAMHGVQQMQTMKKKAKYCSDTKRQGVGMRMLLTAIPGMTGVAMALRSQHGAAEL